VTLVLRPLAAACALLALACAAEARPWGWLGVRIRDLSEQEMEEIAARHGIREGFGVMIVEVLPETPAASSGIKNGDIVVAFEDRPVVDTRMLQRLIGGAPLDRPTRVTVLRAEGRRPVDVRLVSMPREVVGERVAAEFGFVLREPGALGERGAVGERPGLGGRGALDEPGGRLNLAATPAVTVVIRGSSAERGGLEVGDVLVEINERAVITREAARDTLAEVASDRPLRLRVRRGEHVVVLTIPPPMP
jgi:serine protease Do